MRSLTSIILAVLVFLSVSSARADDGPWSGDWDTTWSDGGAILRLEQQGDAVKGEVELFGARLEGKADGSILTCARSLGGRSATLILMLDADGRSFIGRDDDLGWCSGSKVDPSDTAPPVGLETPRDAAVAFVFSASQARCGLNAWWARAMEAAELSPELTALGRAEQLRQVFAYFDLIDLTTFRVLEITKQPSADEVVVPLRQLRTGVELPLTLRKSSKGAWHVVIPNQQEQLALSRSLRAVYGSDPPTAQSYRRLGNPRDTMRAFAEGMTRWRGRGRSLALSTLDLTNLPDELRESDGELAAGYLCRILHRVGFAGLQSISNDASNRDPVVLFDHPFGSIVIAPTGPEPSAPWKFTRDTVQSAEELYLATVGLPEGTTVPPGTIPTTAYFQIRDLVTERASWLHRRLFGLEAWQALGSLLLVAIALPLTRLVAVGAFRLTALSSRAITPPPPIMLHALWMLGFFAVVVPISERVGIPHRYLSSIVPVLGTLACAALAVIAWHAATMLCALLMRLAQRTTMRGDDLAVNLLLGCLRIAVVVGAFVGAAYYWSLPATHVLAGLGIGGISVAFASQQTIAQFFGAGVLVGDRPFGVGDWIQCSGGAVGTLSGVVEGVGFRSTRVRSADGSLLSVPNSALAAVTIVNLGRLRPRPASLQLTVTQGATLEGVESFIVKVRARMMTNPSFIADRTAIGVAGIAKDGIQVQCSTSLSVKSDQEEAAARHQFLVDVLSIAQEEGLGLGPQIDQGTSGSASRPAV